jgi:hypothetical protein
MHLSRAARIPTPARKREQVCIQKNCGDGDASRLGYFLRSRTSTKKGKGTRGMEAQVVAFWLLYTKLVPDLPFKACFGLYGKELYFVPAPAWGEPGC